MKTDYVYVNQDGTVRELSPKERDYLSETFDPREGPFIKSTYETRDGWGSMSGILLRRKIPKNLNIQPVNPSYDIELRKELDGCITNLTQTLDGAVSKTQLNQRPVRENFEISQREYLDWQLKKERLARHPDYMESQPMSEAIVNVGVLCPACGLSVEPTKQRCFAQFVETLPWFAKKEYRPISFERPDFRTLDWACDACIDSGRAILADAKKQMYCDYWPYYAYRDEPNICAACGTNFVFEATEQKYWYETLQFWVQSYPKYCKGCYRQRKDRGARPSAGG